MNSTKINITCFDDSLFEEHTWKLLCEVFKKPPVQKLRTGEDILWDYELDGGKKLCIQVIQQKRGKKLIVQKY